MFKNSINTFPHYSIKKVDTSFNEIETLKFLVAKQGLNFQYKSENLTIKQGIINNYNNYLQTDMCKFFIKKGFTIVSTKNAHGSL